MRFSCLDWILYFNSHCHRMILDASSSYSFIMPRNLQDVKPHLMRTGVTGLLNSPLTSVNEIVTPWVIINCARDLLFSQRLCCLRRCYYYYYCYCCCCWQRIKNRKIKLAKAFKSKRWIASDRRWKMSHYSRFSPESLHPRTLWKYKYKKLNEPKFSKTIGLL